MSTAAIAAVVVAVILAVSRGSLIHYCHGGSCACYVHDVLFLRCSMRTSVRALNAATLRAAWQTA